MNSIERVDTSDLATREYVDDSVSNLATREYVDNSRDNVVDTSNLANLFVRKAGDQMIGNLDKGGNSITQLGNPGRHRDAVNKRYVDTQTVSKHGGEMLGDLQMNGRTIRGLSVDSTTDYAGDEALSYRQVTNLIHYLKDYVDNLRHKPVILLTAYPVITNPPSNIWGFSEIESRIVVSYVFPSAGRIIRIFLLTRTDETIETRVRSSGSSTQQHVIRKENTRNISEAVSIEFSLGDTLSLNVLEGGNQKHYKDSVTTLLELDTLSIE